MYEEKAEGASVESRAPAADRGCGEPDGEHVQRCVGEYEHERGRGEGRGHAEPEAQRRRLVAVGPTVLEAEREGDEPAVRTQAASQAGSIRTANSTPLVDSRRSTSRLVRFEPGSSSEAELAMNTEP